MSDMIESKQMLVELQRNGILRAADGRFIGRLDKDIDYNDEHIDSSEKALSAEVDKARREGEIIGMTNFSKWDLVSFREDTPIMEVDARKITERIAEIYKELSHLNTQESEEQK